MSASLSDAVLLGLVEGLTEFLPISSTGHLILVEHLLGIAAMPGKVFEIVIQLGAILAVCVAYRSKLYETALGLARREPKSIRFTTLVFLGFLPAAVLGALLHGFIKSHLFSPYVVSAMLVLGGIAILFIERKKPAPSVHGIDGIPASLAVKIGFCQALAMIPGVSRSGATIMGGICLGLDRRTAAEYSFFLAIPTMLAATVFDLWKNRHGLDGHDFRLIGVGFLTAFLSALAVVRLFLAFVSRYGFVPFAWYRIAVGGFMLAILATQAA